MENKIIDNREKIKYCNAAAASTTSDIETRLNTHIGLRDVKYIVYRLAWTLNMKKCAEEIFNLMRWDEFHECGYESREHHESLFQFRNTETMLIEDIRAHKHVYRIFTKIGKILDTPLDDDYVICKLPNHYYTFFSISEVSDDEP